MKYIRNVMRPSLHSTTSARSLATTPTCVIYFKLYLIENCVFLSLISNICVKNANYFAGIAEL
jgi:hypothetical protein